MKPTRLKVSLGSQTSREPSIFEGISSHSKGPDTYCYELLINKLFNCTHAHVPLCTSNYSIFSLSISISYVLYYNVLFDISNQDTLLQ